MQQDNRENATGFQTKVDGGAAYIGTNHIYQSSRPPRGIPFQALALPKDYVDRPEIRELIKSKLIDRSVSRPGTLVVSAIYGLGGVGKSVMAAALAHDREVQEVCADGVLWVTLGQNPDLLPCLHGWVQALGDYDFNPTTIDSASSHLRSLLRDKKMLLVVDDAWQTDHVEPFQVGGEGCRVLVTTREAHVQDADRIDLDVMSEAESLELLLSKAQVKSLTAEEAQQARRLIGVVGGLPLAVDLAGAQIADGMSWNELLEDLEAEIAYLESLDRPNAEGVRDEKTRKRLSLKASLNLSLKLLSNEQLQQFAWLGVLPEDVAIQPEMAATLWFIPRKKAGAVLRTFRAKALLLSGVQGLGQESSYRIHDLMHDLARGLLTGKGETDIPGLDLQWLDAHGILLDRYRQQAKDNLWHTLPDDGYIYSYLTWHLERAGRLNELHKLFQEVTTEGRNGWYERCEFLGQNAKFVTDLGRAWKLAEEMYEGNDLPSISLQVRYALIFSTLNSLTSNIPAELMVSLVKNRKWSPAQCLTYAKHAQEPSKCSAIICELAIFLPPILIPEAFEIVQGIKTESNLAHALVSLVPYLPKNLISEAFGIVRGMKDKLDRANVLVSLVPYLPKNLISEAFGIVRGMKDESDRANVLVSLVPYLPENLISEAFGIVRGMKDESNRAIVLKCLPQFFSENLSSKALEIVRDIKTDPNLTNLQGFLPTDLPENSISDALQQMANAMRDDHNSRDEINTNALYSLAVSQSKNLLSEALKIVNRMNHRDLVNVLGYLVPHLSENHFSNVLKIVRKMGNNDLVSVLSNLVPHLSENLLSDVLEMASEIPEYYSVSVLIYLAPHLSVKLLSNALEMVSRMQKDYSKLQVLRSLAVHLPENLLSQALEIAYGINSEADQAQALKALAVHLPENLLSQALEIASRIKDKTYCIDVIRSLATYLPENLLPQALEIVYRIEDESYQANALIHITSYLPEIVSEALEVARTIKNEIHQTDALIQITVCMPQMFLEVLELVRCIQSEFHQVRLAIMLAAYLPEPLIKDIMEIFRELNSESLRSDGLIGLALYLPRNMLTEAIDIAQGIQSKSLRDKTLTCLLANSPEKISEALFIMSGITSECYQADALGFLADRLPENMLLEALKIARDIKSQSCKADALSRLVVNFPEIAPEVIKIVHVINSSYTSAILKEIAAHLPESLLLNTIDIVRKIKSESHQVGILKEIAAHLPGNLLSEAIDIAYGMESEYYQAYALSSLMTNLPKDLLLDRLKLVNKILPTLYQACFFSNCISSLDLDFFDFSFWSRVLHTLSHRDRKHLLEDIPKLAPAIIHLSDRSTLNLVVKAIREVCQQWP